MNRPFDDMPPTQDPVNHDDDPRSDVRIILDLLWRLRSASVAVFALMLAVALLEGLSVGLFMPLVASITGAETFAGGRIATMAANLIASVPPDSRLTVFGAAFVGLLAVKGAMTVAQVNVSYRFIYSIRQHWVERILRHYLDGSLLFMRTQSQGQLVNDLVQETFRSVRAVLDALNLASRTVTIGLLVVLMVLVDWRVTVIAAATGAGAYAATSGIVRRYSRELGRRLLDLNRRIQTGAIQALAGLREIKLYGVQDRTVHRFSSDIADSHRVQTVTHTLMQVPTAVAEVLLGAILVGMLAFVVLVLEADPINYLPHLGVFALAGIRVASNLSFIVQKRLHFGTFVASIRAIHAMIDRAAVPAETGFGGRAIDSVRDRISFDGIRFTYTGERTILDGADLEFEARCVTALVGPSGSGKSTIVDLLAGFYVPDAGDIRIDGTALGEFRLDSWRQRIGYISQEPFLFSTTIRENIALGMPAASDREIMDAAKQAHADEFIASLPDGLDTTLGEGGYGLSLGQRQRIAVARAIARRPSVYIFDESTSGLDADSSAAIESTMRELARESTVILITHRESTAAIADRIYRIADGQAHRTT